MPDRATELAQALADAEEAVRDLSEKVSVNEAATTRAKRAARLALCGIGFDLLLTALIGFGLFGVDTNQDRINNLNERTRTAQCAVNALLLQFEPRTTTNPAYTEEQRAEQRQVYGTLRQISNDLGCPGQ